MKIFVTGDCHGDFSKFNTKNFPQQNLMSKQDIVIICGDFGGIWNNPLSPAEQYWLHWLDRKPFTTVFCDGNHENFDMLNNCETINFHDGKAHKISNSIYHLIRGEIYNFDNKSFFVFGGAASHDITDGILDINNFESEKEFKKAIKEWRKRNKIFRVNHVSYWEQELPNDMEYQNAENNLARYEYNVDYIITHCAPESITQLVTPSNTPDTNRLTEWFDKIKTDVTYKKWYFGHYHTNRTVDNRHTSIYGNIEQII